MRETQSAQANDNSLGRALVRQVQQLGATLSNRTTARAIGLAQGGAVSVYTPSSPSPQISPVGTRPLD